MKIKKGDIIVTLSLLAISFIMAFAINTTNSSASGQVVRIEVNGKLKYELPLDKNDEVIIDDGVHYNKIVIQDGKAFMEEANCRDQICTHMQEISLDGETIICLPNRVFVEVVDLDNTNDESIDKINR